MPSPYTLEENEEYCLVRGISTPSKHAVAPCEKDAPCQGKGICVEPDGNECLQFRGFDPQTRLIACASLLLSGLSEQPLDLKRLATFYTLLNSVNYDLCKLVTNWREETINAICKGELNFSISVNVEFESVKK